MTSTPAGWYPDPAAQQSGQAGQLRYWDGERWTEHVHQPQPAPTYAQPTSGQPGSAQPGPAQQAYGQPPAYGQSAYGQPAYGQASYGQSATTPDGRPLASWGSRLGAALIDGVIVLVLYGIAGLPILVSMFDRLRQNVQAIQDATNAGTTLSPFAIYDGLGGQLAALVAIGLLVNLIYSTLFWRFKGATPGKMMVGLRIEPRDRPGQLTWGQVLKRWLLQFGVAAVIGGIYSLLDGLWPLWDDKRQALHEKWARTNVIRTR